MAEPTYLTEQTAWDIRDRMLALFAARGLDTSVDSVAWDVCTGFGLELFSTAQVGLLAIRDTLFIRTAPPTALPDHGDQLGVEPLGASASTVTLLAEGADGTFVPQGSTVSTESTDRSPAQVFATTADATIAGGTASIPAQAVLAGAAGNVGAGRLIFHALLGVTSLTNPQAARGGVDAEDMEAYRERLMVAAASEPGSGNEADYTNWTLAQPGVGWVLIESRWQGAGTVRVVILDDQNDIPTAGLVASVQAALDPDPQGDGKGLAPECVVVTVVAPTNVPLYVRVPALSAERGYTLDQAKANLEAALDAYIHATNPGGTLRVRDAEAVIIQALGVLDCGDVLLSTDNVSFTRANLALSTTQKASRAGMSYP